MSTAGLSPGVDEAALRRYAALANGGLRTAGMAERRGGFRTRLPSWAQRSRDAAMFKKILFPVDLAEPEMSELAIPAGLALAKASDADLRLVYVQFSVPIAFADYVPVDLGDRLRLAAEGTISELAASIEYAQERVSSIVRFGSVASEVLAEADDWPADLIALGSHRPGVATYVLGSHAAAIVRDAQCSVLVIRSAAAHKSSTTP